MFARMKPGYTVESAKASLQPLFSQILREELAMPELRDVSQYYRDRFLAAQGPHGAGGQRLFADAAALLARR